MTTSDELVKKWRKDHGANIATIGDQAWVDIPRLPTGVFAVDLATGGGFPMGKCAIIYGPESSNKTNLLYGAIREGQKMECNKGKKAAIIDAEHEVNIPWAKQLGVDPDRLIVLHPDYAEQAVDFVESLIYAQDIFCVGLDSIAALTKQSEVENSAEKQSYGGASILVGKMYRKAVVGFSKMHREGVQAPAFIAINQIRMKMDAGPHGNPETMPGGQAQKFAASLILRTYGKNVMDTKMHKVLPVYKECNVIVKKWKVPILSMNAEYKMQMIAAGGNPAGFVADWNTIAAYMKELDYLSKAGPKPGDGWLMNGTKYQTLEQCKETLYGDIGLLQSMKSALIAEMLDKGESTAEAEGDQDLEVVLEE
jgi:recombination protein RecA